MAIERIQLNLIPTGEMPVCHTKQYDKGREIGIDLLYGLKPYYLTDEALELDVRKSDNHLVTIDVPYTEGTSSIVFATTEQMCAVSGSNICALKVTKGGVVIGSLNFIMEVEKSVLEGGLPSESDIENLETQMTAIIDPMLDERVPPLVEELVPQVVGDNYYNKTEINRIVDGIDTALEGIGHDIDGINDDIDNLENELESKANANEVAEALEHKADKEDTYTKEQVDDIVYGILPDDTASGSVANFETDLALPLKSLKIDVNAVQDLHGYANPWTGGGNANLLNPQKCTATTGYGLTTTFDADTETWTISGTPTSQSTSLAFNICTYSDYSLSGKSYVVKAFPISGTTIKNLYGFRTESENKIAIIFDSVANPTINVSFKIMVSATTQSEWTPYSNICPIEGWNEVYLKRCKKNWLDKDTAPVVNGYIDMSAFNTTNHKARTTYIKIPSGCTVTVSKIVSARFSIATAKDIPANGVKVTNRVSRTSAANLTITAGSEDRYLWIWFYLYDTDTEVYEDVLNSIQVEVGSTATDYEPYAGNEYIINLGGTYYGGYVTQDKDGKRQLVVTHKITTFNDLTWGSSTWGNYTAYSATVSEAKSNSTSTLAGLLCEIYPEVTPSAMYSSNNDAICLNGTILRVRDNTYSTFDEWKEAVKNKKIVYPLETPIIIDLPDGEPISTLLGTNNIYADSGDVEVAYKESVELYVNKRIANVQALILNG